MENTQAELKKKVRIRFLLAGIVLGIFLLAPAGTLNYLQAWMYMGVILIPAFFGINYLLKKDPELLERRMHFEEKEQIQKKIVAITSIIPLHWFSEFAMKNK